MKARSIYGRVASATPSAAVLDQMAGLIRQGNVEGAVQVAIDADSFINATIPTLVRPWFSRTDNVEAIFNDGIVTAAYIVSKDMSAKSFLTGNFVAQLDPAIVPAGSILPNGREVRGDLYDDIQIYGNNGARNHYAEIQRMGINLKTTLKAVRQRYAFRHDTGMGITYLIKELPVEQTMGLATTRSFMQDWHSAGTGRSGVQQLLNKFLCINLADVMAFDIPDDKVGHDVTRTPGGSNTHYRQVCKGCHSQMDPLRSVFKNLTFRAEDDARSYVAYTKDADYIGRARIVNNPLGNCAGPGDNQNDLSATDFVPRKYWRNCDANTVRIGEMVQGSTQPQIRFIQGVFGWRPTSRISNVPSQGNWVNVDDPSMLGEYLAGSKAFSSCMVKTVFKQVCKRSAGSNDADLIEQIRQSFEASNYKMTHIYRKLGANPSCVEGL